MNVKRLFLGVDVSKGYSDFCTLDSSKKQLEDTFQLDDEKQGHKVLKQKLLVYLKQFDEVMVGVENTGGYERNWVKAVQSLSTGNKHLKVYKLNPKAVKHQIQSMMKRVVDDGVSAYGIAVYMINHQDLYEQNWKNSISETEEVTEGKMLHSMIHALLKQRTMKINQLEKLLYQANPELLQYIKQSVPQWVLYLIQKYPTAKSIRAAQLRGLAKVKGVSEQKAFALKAAARDSVAAIKGAVVATMIIQYSKDILYLNEEIDRFKKVLADLFKDDEKVKLLTSVRGIAEWTAVSFLIELGDYKRFNDTNQLASFFGVNPSFKQSGDGLFKVKMSKQGSAKMRSVLYLIAHNLVMHNPYFKPLYTKHRAKGKKHRVVMGILMHKALRILWGMLKSNTPFNEDIDLENQRKNQEVDTLSTDINLKGRRYQEISLNAPISRSNAKKRRAILQPQSSQKDEKYEVLENSPMQT